MNRRRKFKKSLTTWEALSIVAAVTISFAGLVNCVNQMLNLLPQKGEIHRIQGHK